MIPMSHPQHGVQTGANIHGVQHGTARPPLPFTEAEIQEFQKSDRQAGGSVVVLMALIFTIGVLLYGAIDYLIVA
jgi:hypothetical protein